VALRNCGKEPIFDIVINPYNKYEFVTAGYKNVSTWEINGKNLLRFLFLIIFINFHNKNIMLEKK